MASRDRLDHDVEPLRLDQRLDGLDLLGHRRSPEVQVGDVEEAKHRDYSREITALVNSAVPSVPPVQS